jgi:hypothetical protein
VISKRLKNYGKCHIFIIIYIHFILIDKNAVILQRNGTDISNEVYDRFTFQLFK